ncbi:MAG: hypothetical protein ACXWCK_33715 [Burkholderiales bacterium]
MDMSLATTSTLPPHGRISCRRCFSGAESTQTIGKWQMVNDPAAWGSATPRILILGFSKGFTQANAFRSGRFEDIPFKDMRTRLTEELRLLGVIGSSEAVDQKMVASETEIGFGSLWPAVPMGRRDPGAVFSNSCLYIFVKSSCRSTADPVMIMLLSAKVQCVFTKSFSRSRSHSATAGSVEYCE